MKRSAMILGGVAAMQLFGCMSGEIDTSTGEEKPTWEEFRAGVYQEPESGLFIVNGDTPVDGEKNLREFYDQVFAPEGALIVHRVGSADAKWSDTQKLNLTYCVGTMGSSSRRTATINAMNAATQAWEAVANVNFVHVTAQDNAACTSSNGNVVFDVNSVNAGGQYLARAFFPNNARSSRNVLIDGSAFGSIPPWTLAGILRHELGHTLGFRHEHTRPEAGTCFEDNSWRVLTPYDAASVMHYPQCNGTQTGDLVITTRDAQGAAALYGAPGSQPPPPPPPGTPTTVTRSGTAALNAFVQVINVPVVAGTTVTATTTGTGDPDLYVRFGSAPTTASYSCRSWTSTATERCSLTVPAGQSTVYVGINGYTASTYNLTLTYTAP